MPNKMQGILARVFVAVVILSVVFAAVYYVVRGKNDQKALDNVLETTSLYDLDMSDSGREEKSISLTSQAYWTCGERLSRGSITGIMVVPVRKVGIETIREYHIQVLYSDQVVAVLTVVERPVLDSSGGKHIVETWSCTGPK